MGFSLKDPIRGSITGNAGSADVAKKTQAALTIQKNGTTVGSTFDGSTAQTINITVPTTVASLTDASNYVKKTDYASASAAGVVKLGTGLAIADGVLSVTGAATAESVEWSVVKNKPTNVSYWTNDSGYITRSNTMSGATSTTAGTAGTVPAPAAGKEAQFLRGDGTWAQPSYATSAGSATKATQDGNGNVITSTYLPLAGGTLSGAVAFGTSSTTSAPTTGIQVHDIRNATITPSSMGDRNANFYFFQYSGWKSIMRVKGWNGSYTTWELCGPADTSANDTLQFRSGVGETWRNWKTIAFTDSNITGNAATATSATKATQDGDGKTISSTYLKLTGGKLSGPLSFASAQPLTWVDGTYQQRLNIVDDADANTNVFEFQQSTDSGATFVTLAAIKDNGKVVATTFVGALEGNASTATKATQDGNGKVIANTYLPLSGGTLTTTAYNGITLKRSDSNGSSILYANSAGNLGRIGFIAGGDMVMTNGTGTDGTANMLKITSAGAMTVYGALSPSTNNANTLGTSSLKWSNVYATTFTGSMSTSLTINQNGASTTYNGGTARTVSIPTVHTGTGTPADTIGQNGDIYIVTN